jgi:hypothetical protein
MGRVHATELFKTEVSNPPFDTGNDNSSTQLISLLGDRCTSRRAIKNRSRDRYDRSKNGYLFVAIVFFGFVANMLIASAFFSYLIAKYNGWSAKQTIDYIIFVRDVPQHWLKDAS